MSDKQTIDTLTRFFASLSPEQSKAIGEGLAQLAKTHQQQQAASPKPTT